jgi:two-component system, OmpR family, heavy metal sensor histidine kinase CusS
MNRSLRVRLLLGIAATTAIIFVVTAVTLYTLMRRGLLAEFDDMLATKARALAVMVEQQDDRILVAFEKYRMQEFARTVRPEYFQIRQDSGEVVSRSRRLGTNDLPGLHGSLNAPTYQDMLLPDGRPGRAVGIRFLPHVDGEILDLPTPGQSEDHDTDDVDPFDYSARKHVTLVVAAETAPVDRALAELKWLLTGVFGAAITLLLVVLAWIVTRNLDPLRRLAEDIAAIDEETLSSRFECQDSPRELEAVVERLNGLMTRLDQAFRREKTFTADVAHELRTPLAGLRTTLEVAVRRPRQNAEYLETIEDCREICEDTQRIVETLLSLTRIESGQAIIQREPIDLALLAEKVWELFSDRANDRELEVEWDFQPEVLLNSDPEKLRVVLSNLMDNAVSYAEPGGTIIASTKVSSDGLSLEISSPGCNLSDTQIAHVFDRFWRADSARSATGTHAGLGLSLCRKLLTLLGGVIKIEQQANRFVVVAEFARSDVVSGVSTEEPLTAAVGS